MKLPKRFMTDEYAPIREMYDGGSPKAVRFQIEYYEVLKETDEPNLTVAAFVEGRKDNLWKRRARVEKSEQERRDRIHVKRQARADKIRRLLDGEELNEIRCIICNRKLTDEDSRRRGIGPECGKDSDAMRAKLEAILSQQSEKEVKR